ncbi:MAG: preprotein translocase subunit SecG [Lentisphaeria bacterium]|nr:preprotein translocase subunit SecG [Lentisphaeria bacterium]MBO5992227.1 preprotein translocase subunit SecG [Lentisphaeria bacterium]MBO7152668.1 preprotein translocase subunit SecG [Lentisphaeria bacterium]
MLLVFLYALVVVVSLLLIGLILIQPAKSGGMGAAFGGVGESVFGGKAGSHLTKATVWMTALFFVLCLALAVLIGHGFKVESGDAGLEKELSVKKVETKAEAKAPEAKTEAKKAEAKAETKAPAAKPAAKKAAK